MATSRAKKLRGQSQDHLQAEQDLKHLVLLNSKALILPIWGERGFSAQAGRGSVCAFALAPPPRIRDYSPQRTFSYEFWPIHSRLPLSRYAEYHSVVLCPHAQDTPARPESLLDR